MAELGNPLTGASLIRSWRGYDGTTDFCQCHVQVTAVSLSRDLDPLVEGLEPAQRVNRLVIDDDLKVEVAARGGARGAAERHLVATLDLLPHFDADRA